MRLPAGLRKSFNKPAVCFVGAFTACFSFYLARIYYHSSAAFPSSIPLTSVCDGCPVSNTTEAGSSVESYSVEKHITNATLGFETVFAIGLPERTDRRDRLTLMTHFQGVELQWIDAVKGEDIPEKAYPPHWYPGNPSYMVGHLGCWRSHVNVLRKIVEEDISSALIIEDDADWDVEFKTQLTAFANFTRNIENLQRPFDDQLTASTPTHSPYGSSWDLLWFGHCENGPVPADAQIFAGEDDARYHSVWAAKDGGLLCTFGYAVSQKGATKLLGFVMDTSSAIDWAMSDFCQGAECIVVEPRLIGQHNPPGSFAASSDTHDEEGWRARGDTPEIVNSALINALERTGGTRLWGERETEGEKETEGEQETEDEKETEGETGTEGEIETEGD